MGQLVKVRKHFPRHVIKLAYEASYIGFTLQRDLADKKYHCDVVAPSSIPRQRGKAIKTDRIDAAQLAQFYANDLLTLVQVPELEMEQDRDLMRSRQSLMHQREQVRRHLQSLLRRNGLHYKAETQAKSHWTIRHHSWLERTIAVQPGSLKVNLPNAARSSCISSCKVSTGYWLSTTNRSRTWLKRSGTRSWFGR